MKFKTIFIGNIAEMAKPLMKLMDSQASEGELWEDRWLCDRFLFSDLDDRILITPVSLDKDFFDPQSICAITTTKIINLLF